MSYAEPRITALDLARYATSPPLVRQSILEQSKYPMAHHVERYGPAREIIVDLITKGKSTRVVDIDLDEHNADAVKSYLGLSKPSEFKLAAAGGRDGIDMSGVHVQVDTDATIVDQHWMDIGSITLAFFRDRTPPRAFDIAATVQHAIGKSNQWITCVVDVFGQRIVKVPISNVAWHDAVDACAEIRRAWASV